MMMISAADSRKNLKLKILCVLSVRSPKDCGQKMKKGFSIIELLVVMAIVAALVALAIPAINAMQKSFNSTGTEGMISTALATARTLAISRGQYAGVRFQKIYDPAGALKADQYMIFIKEDNTTWVCGFSAVDGYKPIKLPSNIGVVDKIVWPGRHTLIDPLPHCGAPTVVEAWPADLNDIGNLAPDGSNRNITDISTFSIVFSPAGKLVIQKLRCASKGSNDDIFNNPPTGMFFEDDYENYGIGVEMSRREFYIYNRNEFEKLTTGAQRLNYLNGPKTEEYFVNAYTGELIK